MSKVSVLLADDHEVVRAGYRRLFENTGDIDVVAEATDGEQAYQLYMEYKPGVVVMDLTMPGIGGLDACRRILARDRNARILVFSVHENEIFLNRALDQGVLGYISKRNASRVMIEAVRCVARGELFIGQEMMPFLVKRKASQDSQQMAGLSPREFEIFRLRADGKSVNEIADLLSLSPKTVGHHNTSVKQKLGIANEAELTRLAIRLGVIDA
ncbi:LuxR family two component transcriptional regulator [Thiogranum longum]|uniref:LuxR family two component transcriptional regulator n=1 Tax=Thiogranum longum TaxID=1537524 RepID=A0A4R1H918_9GAMM|nr:response regulator transcription factor [Thiogranum longum]TCK18347.1 LuxR family two component transcriptional regulator [Thiogranum longum]